MQVYFTLNKGVTLVHDGRLFLATIIKDSIIAYYVDDMGYLQKVIPNSIYGQMIIEELEKLNAITH